MNRMLVIFTLILGCALPTLAQDTKGIKTANLKNADLSLMKNHDPAAELANFKLLPGYEVNLFASEPMLANPVHMMWDSRGRLWVACSWAYPQLKPGEKPNDKIIILEDTDGDGKADKSTVFADGLYIPTGIELANGGCYVAQSPDVFFFKDTNGDDVADVKEVALTGFGIEDSHHSISAWRRGPGGWIYFQEGIFLHTQVETQYGVVRNFNGGVYQFNPRTQELRMFCRGTGGNPWGHVFDRWGQSFMVNNPRIMHLSPWTGNSGKALSIKPLISTEKQCGGDLATGTHIGKDLRGQLLTGRFKSRTVVRYEFIENGAGFSANVLPPLISSKHPNFRPVDVKVGADGAIYVADWYNSIINHAQHDFRDPRRDHDHGRIWRITAKNRPLVKKPKLIDAPIAGLLNHLKSPETWIRHQARKELSERDHDGVAKAINEWVANLDPKEADHDHHLVEAMWACQNVERPSEVILQKVMSAKDGNARAAGARVIRYWHDKVSDPIAMIAKAAGDVSPRVRMEAILSAGFIPKAEAFTAAMCATDHSRDSLIDVALSQTTAALEPYWKPALEAGTLKFLKPEHRAAVARQSGADFERRLASFLRQKRHTPAQIAEVKQRLIANGTVKQVGSVLKSLTRGKQRRSPQFTVAMLDALQQIGRRGDMSLGKGVAGLQKYVASRDDAITVAAAANMGAWKLEKAAPELFAILKNGQREEAVRRAASIAIGEIGRLEHIAQLKQLTKDGDVDTRYMATHGLIVANLDEASVAAAKLFTVEPGEADSVALVSAFLGREKGANALAKSLKAISLNEKVVARVADYHRRTGQLPSSIAPLFQDTSSTLTESLMNENRKRLVADVEKFGNAERGELIYRRKSTACTVCHGIGPVGPAIGPNLVAVGAAANAEYIAEAILEPNKSIAEHYENMLITTKDGGVRTGVITFRSEKEVVIRDSTQAGNQFRIPVSTIKKMKPMMSLMPAGLPNQLKSRQEFLDLVRFVSLLGRPGPYANDESPFIRKWKIIGVKGFGAIPDANADWTTAYAKVNGELPATDFNIGKAVFAQGAVNVQVAGSVALQLDTKGLRLWIDGKEVADLASPIELNKGRHTLTFGIDPTRRGETGLQVKLESAPGSAAKFQPEGGL